MAGLLPLVLVLLSSCSALVQPSGCLARRCVRSWAFAGSSADIIIDAQVVGEEMLDYGTGDHQQEEAVVVPPGVAPPGDNLRKTYRTATWVWLGASADVAKSTGAAGMASFGLATVATMALSKASVESRLDSSTYRRLNAVFAIFGAAHAALVLSTGTKPLSALALLVASSACVAGWVEGAKKSATSAADLAREASSDAASTLRSLIPSLSDSTIPRMYWLVVVSSIVGAGALAPSAAALSQFAFAGVGGVLLDAARRNRLDATTFRQLNLALGAALITTAYATLKKIIVARAFASPIMRPMVLLALSQAVGGLFTSSLGLSAFYTLKFPKKQEPPRVSDILSRPMPIAGTAGRKSGFAAVNTVI